MKKEMTVKKTGFKMRKLLIGLVLVTALLAAGCSEEEQKEAANAQAGGDASVSAPVEEVINETSEEYGEIAPENTEEETGEVASEFTLDASAETSDNALIVELTADSASGYQWVYSIGDEAVAELENKNFVKEEGDGTGGTEQFVFRAKQEGETQILFYYASPEEYTTDDSGRYVLIPPEDVEPDSAPDTGDVMYRIQVDKAGEKLNVVLLDEF